jgi:hypothetical protein
LRTRCSREQRRVERIATDEIAQHFSEITFVLLQHLLRFIQGIIAVAQDINQSRVQLSAAAQSWASSSRAGPFDFDSEDFAFGMAKRVVKRTTAASRELNERSEVGSDGRNVLGTELEDQTGAISD